MHRFFSSYIGINTTMNICDAWVLKKQGERGCGRMYTGIDS